MKNKWTSLLIGGILLVMAVGLTQAQELQPPQQAAAPQVETGTNAAVSAYIPVQGRLTDASGKPVPDGNYSITASIYTASSGGTALCSTTQSVSVSSGLFNMTIDNCGSNDINGQQLYLGIKVGSDTEMLPRQPIYAVPYAMSLIPGGQISYTPFPWAGTYADLSGNLGSGISWLLGYSYWDGISSQRSNYGVKAEASDGNNAYGVSGYAETDTKDGHAYGLYGHAAISATNGIAYGLYGEADARGSGSAAYGVYGVNYSTRQASHGVYGRTEGDWGYASGVYGTTANPHAQGVTGWNTGAGIGVYGYSETGIAIKAAGTGIIQSTADTQIAVSPLKMVTRREYVSTVILRPDWTGYMVVEPSSSGDSYTIVPVDLPNLLFGTALKLKSIQVCYRCNNAGSYISATYVGWRTDSGYYDAISNSTDRTETSWTCYTVADSVPDIITGPIYIDFGLYFAGTGSSHDISIGKIILTLTEQ